MDQIPCMSAVPRDFDQGEEYATSGSSEIAAGQKPHARQWLQI